MLTHIELYCDGRLCVRLFTDCLTVYILYYVYILTYTVLMCDCHVIINTYYYYYYYNHVEIFIAFSFIITQVLFALSRTVCAHRENITNICNAVISSYRLVTLFITLLVINVITLSVVTRTSSEAKTVNTKA